MTGTNVWDATMPYRSMSIKEVARLLGADVRRVERLAQRGEIPCQKVGGGLRFNRAEIIEWLHQQVGSLKEEHLAEVDAGIASHRQEGAHLEASGGAPRTAPEDTVISNLLRPEAVAVHLPARTKNSVLKELVGLAQKTGLLYDPAGLLEALIQREELRSTALEGGLAIPHPRRPMPYVSATPLLVVAHTSQGIGFGAADGGLTDLFFLTCSPDDRHHLHVLARLCRLLRDPRLADDLRQAASPEQIISRLRDAEKDLLKRSEG